MKSKNRIFEFCILFIFLLLVSCGKDENSSPESNFSVAVSDVLETGFEISWTSGKSLNSVFIELCEKEDFSNVFYNYTEDQGGTTHQFTGLKGATQYYYRLTANFSDGDSYGTDILVEQTSFASETVTINTTDGLELSGKLSYLSYIDEPKPAVILMHELGVWVNNWKAADVVRQLVAEGYVCLTFDFRGHGNSTPIPDLGMLISDWSLVATDLQSAMAFMKNNPRVDSLNFALAGGSLGAIMSLAGNGYPEVKSSVALSPAKMGVYEIFPSQVLNNVCYIVGELDIHDDPNVNFPAESEYLYGITSEPREMKIVSGSSAHGTDLLESTGIEELILQWIKAGFEE